MAPSEAGTHAPSPRHRVGAPNLSLSTLSNMLPAALHLGRSPKHAPEQELSRFALYAKQMQEATLPDNIVRKLHESAEIKLLFFARRRKEDLALVLALFGVLVMCAEIYTLPSPSTAHSDTPTTLTLKTLITLSTVALELTLVQRYALECRLLLLQHRLPRGSTVWNTWALLKWLFVEMAICGYHVPPGVDFVIDMNQTGLPPYGYHVDVMGFFMWIRFYMVASLIRNHSGYYSQQTALVGAWNGVDALSMMFHVKCLFKDRPSHILLPLAVLSISVTALGVFAVERDVNEFVLDFGDALWLTIVTVSSVGYGDIVPVTWLGRVLTVLGGVAGGVFLLALLTTALVAGVELTDEEAKVLRFVSSARWQKALHEHAATLIQRSYRIHRAGGVAVQQQSPALDALFAIKTTFHHTRTTKPQVFFETPEVVLQRISTRLENVERQREVGMAALEQKIAALTERVGELCARR